MEKLQRNLVICGLCLIVSGFVYGLGYTILVEHRALLELKDAYGSAFVEFTQGMEASKTGEGILDSFDEIKESSVRYRRAIGAHTHAINLGLLVILLGTIFSFALGKTKKGRWVALLFITGAFTYPTGLALQALGLVWAGEVFAVLGSGAVVASLAILLAALFIVKPTKPS